eukprot:scaffold1112_cov116-Isochrysis_galbana.AAC.39
MSVGLAGSRGDLRVGDIAWDRAATAPIGAARSEPLARAQHRSASARQDLAEVRLKSVWRRALRSPRVQSHHPGVSGDRCAGWQLARVAERRLWPFQVPVVAAVLRIAKKQCVWGRCASRTPEFLSGGSVYVSKRALADPQIGHQSKW